MDNHPKIMYGKDAVAAIKDRVKQFITDHQSDIPTLAIVYSSQYATNSIDQFTKGIIKDCNEVGINIRMVDISSHTVKKSISVIKDLNEDPNITGVIIQRPIPFTREDEERVVASIDPNKSIDMIHPLRVVMPCTPTGIMSLLLHYTEDDYLNGKHVVIINRSENIGRPLVNMLLDEDATVTICHSHTQNLEDITKTADVLITAVGIPRLIRANMLKEDAIVIDAGCTIDKNGKTHGDVYFEEACKKVSAISPVPGGVGPMTRAAVMENVIHLWNYQHPDTP